MDSTVRINVFSTPRTLSTALMYCFNQRPDCKALDEPLYAHHLRVCPHLQAARPYLQELFASQSQDGNEVVKQEVMGPCDKPVLYVKHMAKQIQGLDLGFLSKTKNVLLIRDPVRVLSSFNNKLDSSSTMEEMGFVELVQLQGELARLGQEVIVVDSDDLQRDPEGILRALCAKLGIPFCPEQLSWPAGPKACDGCWASFWYDGVWKSTGFEAGGESRYTRFPPALLPLLRACLPFYEALKLHALRPLSSSCSSSKGTGASVDDHGLSRSIKVEAPNEDILAWVGGRLVPRELAKVSAFDSTVQGGDAVWEGIRVYDGRVFKLHDHLQRLVDSAKAMAFKGVPSVEEVKEAVFQLLAANGMRDGAHMRLTLSRGLKTTSSMNPVFNAYGCCLIILAEWKPVGGAATYDNTSGIRLITAANRRNPPQCVDSKIHHCNLINNILAKIQANDANAQDAIMLDLEGFVSETNATNIFAVKQGRVLTPHADYCLPGVTRQTVINLIHDLGLPFAERRVSLAELHSADEVFTTGTMGELTPVVDIDGRVIGEGRLGPITRRIQEAYRGLTETLGEPLPF